MTSVIEPKWLLNSVTCGTRKVKYISASNFCIERLGDLLKEESCDRYFTCFYDGVRKKDGEKVRWVDVYLLRLSSTSR